MDVPRSIDRGAFLTRADVIEVGTKIEKLDLPIDTANANLKVEILRWLVVTTIALGGFIFAAMNVAR